MKQINWEALGKKYQGLLSSGNKDDVKKALKIAKKVKAQIMLRTEIYKLMQKHR